ncbi:MAG: cupin domain-containing protein [Cyanobacteria bacterium J06592_8]
MADDTDNTIMKVLAKLLHPYPVGEFFDHHWTTQALRIPADEPHQFASLFSWETLNYLLNFSPLQYPDLRLALEGKVLDANEIQQLTHWLQQGATLIIDRVHEWVPDLAKWTAALRWELGYATQINAYASFPQKQGFSSHYDTHDVFILQIEGCKTWNVFSETLKFPLKDQKSVTLSPPEDPPYLNCMLSPGDVLYIPRGHWHYAVAGDTPSLHLTLGIHTKTGIDWLEWWANQLRNNEEWRASLPLPQDTVDLKQHLQQLSQSLSEDLIDSDRINEYIQYLNALGKPITKYSLPQQMGFNIFPQDQLTTFKTQPFQRVQIFDLPDVDSYRITTQGKEVFLTGVPRAVWEKLFQQSEFTGEEVLQWLPDFDWELDLVPLLTRLVQEGILVVESR